MTTALEGREGSASRPGRSLPLGKTRYPFYRRLDGPQGLSGQVWKISLPRGFDPRTVQPVASWYTDWAAQVSLMLRTPTQIHFRKKCWTSQNNWFSVEYKILSQQKALIWPSVLYNNRGILLQSFNQTRRKHTLEKTQFTKEKTSSFIRTIYRPTKVFWQWEN
jgi:hypothetical protein